MSENKPILIRKSTFINSQDLIDISPKIYRQTTANEELSETFEKNLDPLLKKVKKK